MVFRINNKNINVYLPSKKLKINLNYIIIIILKLRENI